MMAFLLNMTMLLHSKSSASQQVNVLTGKWPRRAVMKLTIVREESTA